MSGRRSTPSSAGATSSSGRLKKNPNFFQSSPSAQSFSKDIPSGVLSQARKTGTLNLSDKLVDLLTYLVSFGKILLVFIDVINLDV